jgi:hypothetical protein
MPLNSNEQNTKPLATYILCIHYKEYEFTNLDLKTKFQEILIAYLEIQAPYTSNPNITPTNTKVNTSTQMDKYNHRNGLIQPQKWTNTTTEMD